MNLCILFDQNSAMFVLVKTVRGARQSCTYTLLLDPCRNRKCTVHNNIVHDQYQRRHCYLLGLNTR